MLDPPLWSEKSKKLEDALNRKQQPSSSSSSGGQKDEEPEAAAATKPDDIPEEEEPPPPPPPKARSLKRFLPSLSRAKASQKTPEAVEAKTAPSSAADAATDPVVPRISALERIDTVFKVVYQDGHRPEMPRKDKSGSGGGGAGCGGGNDGANASSAGGGAGTVAAAPLSAKSRTADWFANLFSPNKSRNNSSSTDTSRYITVLYTLFGLKRVSLSGIYRRF